MRFTAPPGTAAVPWASPSALAGQRSRLLLLAAGMFALGTDGYVIAGLLPAVGASLRVSVSAAGQLVTVFALVYALAAPLLGGAAAAWPRKAVLVASLAAFAAANVGTALAAGYWPMMAARIAAALAAAAFTPAASAAGAALVAPAARGRALAAVMTGVTVATAAGVPAGTLLGGAAGWRATFAAIAALAALIAGLLAWRLPPLPPVAGAGLRERVTAARLPGVPAALLVTLLWITGAFTAYTYLAATLGRVAGAHGGAVSVWLLVFGAAAVAGNLAGGRAADRRPLRPLLVAGTGGLACALAALALLAWADAHGLPGALGAAAALAVWGLFGWSVAPVQQHRLVTISPAHGGVLLSLNVSALYLGIAAGGALGGLALRQGGVAAVGWAALAIELLALLAVAATRPARPAR